MSWHDLAFLDPVMYESLRQLVLDSRTSEGANHLSSLGLTFHVTLRPEEGGGSHNLLGGKGGCPVTPENVYEYVRRYAELRMVEVNREALQVCQCVYARTRCPRMNLPAPPSANARWFV